MREIIEKNIGELIALISIIDPQSMIIGRLKEVGENYIKLSNSIWYKKDNIYTLISLISNMYKHFMNQLIRLRIGNNQPVAETVIEKEVEAIMNEIVEKTLNSITPEVLPTFVLKPINSDPMDVILDYRNFIFVDIRNIKDKNVLKYINDYINLFYGNTENVENKNVISDQTGNA